VAWRSRILNAQIPTTYGAGIDRMDLQSVDRFECGVRGVDGAAAAGFVLGDRIEYADVVGGILRPGVVL
jgi:hypothetical protein